jgi:uncharacterized protein
VFGTLIGAGGGFILMPVLLLMYPHDTPDAVTSISLAVTFANAFSGSLAYAWMKRIDYKNGLVFAGAAIPGAVLGALSTYYVHRRTFDLIFGILLVIVSASIYFKTLRTRAEVDEDLLMLSSLQSLLGVGISLTIGYISGFLGIGGGIIYVPALAGILHFPIHIATATSQFIQAIITFAGVLVHTSTGTIRYDDVRTLFLVLGVLPGAQEGAYLSSRIKGNTLMRVMAVALTFAAVRLLFLSASEF